MGLLDKLKNNIKGVFKGGHEATKETHGLKQSKIEEINALLTHIEFEKLEEIKLMLKGGKPSKEEINRFLIFKDIRLTDADILALKRNDYRAIESRIAVLGKYNFPDDLIFVGILFLKDNNDDYALYDSDIDISQPSFHWILFYLSVALFNTEQYVLCEGYIQLLMKLHICHPNELSPPKEEVDKISFNVFLKLRQDTIYQAAEKGDIKTVQQHISNGANLNKTEDDMTPLLYAAGKGHKEIVELLLNAGADINKKNSRDFSAILLATTGNRLETVKLLIKLGADVNSRNKLGNTPLYMATKAGFIDVADCLRNAGGCES